MGGISIAVVRSRPPETLSGIRADAHRGADPPSRSLMELRPRRADAGSHRAPACPPAARRRHGQRRSRHAVAPREGHAMKELPCAAALTVAHGAAPLQVSTFIAAARRAIEQGQGDAIHRRGH